MIGDENVDNNKGIIIYVQLKENKISLLCRFPPLLDAHILSSLTTKMTEFLDERIVLNDILS